MIYGSGIMPANSDNRFVEFGEQISSRKATAISKLA